MSNRDYPSYSSLNNSSQTNSQQTLVERFAYWFRNFLENAE